MMGLTEKLTAIWHPEVYHGDYRRAPFFEGWYYKVTTPEGKSFAFIPGVHFGKKEGSYAFIQAIDESDKKVELFRFELKDCAFKQNPFEIRIGNNVFTNDGIRLDLNSNDATFRGQARYSEPLPWPVTFRRPGYMGWYALVPFLRCYHGVVTRNSFIKSGSLVTSSTSHDLTDGKAYIEKDWGNSFPSSYIWIQSNGFDNPDAALVVSVARMKLFGISRVAFVAGLTVNEEFYCFATYTSAKITKALANPSTVHLTLEDSRHRLELSVDRVAGMDIFVPTEDGMRINSNQTLHTQIHTKLIDKRAKNKRELFAQTGRAACLEIKGDLSALGVR